MTASSLDHTSHQITATLISVRDEGLSFAERLHDIQGRMRLNGFDAVAFFDGAVKEAYDRLQEAFICSRMCFGKRPDIDDHAIKDEFIKSLDCDSYEKVAAVDVGAAVSRALQKLNHLLPEEAAENEVNRQLAAKFVKEFHLERQEVVEKSGAVVLEYRASIDSINKKYDKRNDYSYYTREWLHRQLVVLQEMVIHFNQNTGKRQPTGIPAWFDLDGATRGISRSPNVIDVCGFKLKVGVSKYEFHLSPEFAAYLNEFISLANCR